jgi:hypothetical protein
MKTPILLLICMFLLFSCRSKKENVQSQHFSERNNRELVSLQKQENKSEASAGFKITIKPAASPQVRDNAGKGFDDKPDRADKNTPEAKNNPGKKADIPKETPDNFEITIEGNTNTGITGAASRDDKLNDRSDRNLKQETTITETENIFDGGYGFLWLAAGSAVLCAGILFYVKRKK